MTASLDRPALAQEAAACRRLYVTPELLRKLLSYDPGTGGSDEFA